jgi:hypothetical protein
MDNDNNKPINDVTAPSADDANKININIGSSSAPQSSAAATPAPATSPDVSSVDSAISSASMPDASPVTPDSATPAPAMVTNGGSGKKGGYILRLVLELLLVVAIAGLGFYVMQLTSKNKDLNNQINVLNQNPAIKQQKEADAAEAKVKKLITIKSDEKPQVIKITDPVAFKKEQPFFSSAEKDDLIVVFFKSNQAILYRPSSNKIILVAPINLTNSTTTTAKPATTTGATTPASTTAPAGNTTTTTKPQ